MIPLIMIPKYRYRDTVQELCAKKKKICQCTSLKELNLFVVQKKKKKIEVSTVSLMKEKHAAYIYIYAKLSGRKNENQDLLC